MQGAPRVSVNPPPELTIATMPKTFLDLPAELRNRIYELISDHSITIPMLPWRSPRSALANGANELESQSGSTVDLGTGKHQSHHESSRLSLHRLGMLLANRQIHDEAWSMFYSKATLDMTGVQVDGLDRRLHYAMDMLGPKLKVTERIKIDSSIAQLFLWTPYADVRAFEAVSQFTVPADVVSAILAFRSDPVSLNSVEIVRDGLEDRHIGAQTLVNLAGQRSRPILHQIFPDINDIILNYGYRLFERFIRSKNEGWQREGTGEKVPTRVHSGWGYPKMRLDWLQPDPAWYLDWKAVKLVGPEAGEDK